MHSKDSIILDSISISIIGLHYMVSNWQSEPSTSGLPFSTVSVLLYHITASTKFCFLKLKACFFGSHGGKHGNEGPWVLLITVQTLREKLISFQSQ